MPSLCRDCLEIFETGPRCPACGRPRVLSHPELYDLTVAHMDCDAFYASVEKRDNPDLRDKPVIIGGGKRGVVSTACYIARINGVRSAMPMFQALKLCPDAVVVRGRMEVYAAVSAQIRAMMEDLTPSIEPLSLDEAFLDLSGTARVHGKPPAVLLAGLVRRMAEELGITGSIGLSHNKFLAKIASDLDKPEGFAVIGKAETADFLANRPVRLIWGIGEAGTRGLDAAGIRTFADLRRWDQAALTARFGTMGTRLWHLARGEDHRSVTRNRAVKSISNETTFAEDISDIDLLDGHLWRMAEKVADRAKAKERAGRVVTLKLKRGDFKTVTRRHALPEPTQMADRIYRTARDLMDTLPQGTDYRLLGVGLSEISSAEAADREMNLLDPNEGTRLEAERAADRIRARFGDDAIMKGRALR